MGFWKNKKQGRGLDSIAGAGIPIIDDELSSTSPHPLKNSAIAEEFDKRYGTEDDASTTINDSDYIPMSDSEGGKKKALWSTIMNKITNDIGRMHTFANNIHLYRIGRFRILSVEGATLANVTSITLSSVDRPINTIKSVFDYYGYMGIIDIDKNGIIGAGKFMNYGENRVLEISSETSAVYFTVTWLTN